MRDSSFSPETLQPALADPDQPTELALPAPLSPAERQQLLWEWNDTATRFPATTLDQLLAGPGVRCVEAIALVFPADGCEARYSYGELRRRVSRLAADLQASGVGPEARVGVCAGRTPAMVEALLAVLTAGGAYVALDPAYPEARLALILEDAQANLTASVLLVEAPYRHRLPTAALVDSAVVELGPTATPRPLPTQALHPGPRPHPENLAYVLYTSGSTGRPKGVAITHRSGVALLFWARRILGDAELAGVLATTSINFDLSVFELLVPLAWGGTAIVVENALALAAPAASRGALRAARLLNTVPSAAAELLRQAALPPGLVTVNLAGEALHQELVEALYQQPGIGRVLDLYGPSEDTTYSTWATRRPGGVNTIGRPLAGTRTWVVHGLDLVPAGNSGELCLAGSGLARGYLNRPGLTAERFVPAPFADALGERMYRTGDQARFLPDGQLQFLGRLDHQVKVRGFRIELGEIEARLLAHPQVSAAVVWVVPGAPAGTGAARLFAGLVGTEGAALSADALRGFLAQTLPEHMVPTGWLFLSELPRLPNGKVDRQRLAELAAAQVRAASESEREVTAPQDPLTTELARLWGELLGLPQVGIDDDFLELGGHSLLFGRLLSRLRMGFGVELSVRDLYQHRTLAAMAAEVSRAMGGGQRAQWIARAPRDQELPLSFPQERIWFIDRLAPGNVAYNTQATLRLWGPLRVAVFAAVLQEIVERHEIFRTIFPERAGRPLQVVQAAPEIRLPQIDLSRLAPAQQARTVERLKRSEFSRPFDLRQIPLVRWRLVRLSADEHVLLQSEHHFVHDGWSLAMLLTEMQELYRAFSTGRPSPLPAPAIQFADYARWQREWMQGAVLEQHLQHWQQVLAGCRFACEIPTDRPRPRIHSFQGDMVRFHLAPELCAELRQTRQREKVTLFTLMVGAFAALFYRSSGESDVVLGTGAANRSLRQVEGLIGMLVNTLVLRLDAAGRPRFRELLQRAEAALLSALAYPEMPLARLVERLEPERDLGRNPLFQAMLSFHDSPVPDLEFGDLRGEVTICHNGSAKMDLNVIVIPRAEQRVGRVRKAAEEGIEMLWEYSTDLFDRTTIERLTEHYLILLGSALKTPELRLEDLTLLSPGELQQVLIEWSGESGEPGGALPDRQGAALPELFAASAAARPEAVAASCEDALLTWQTLARQAHQLAHHLRRLGIGPESRVGLYLERSLELPVGILGILAAGGAYLPVDPHYPTERVQYMLQDAGASVVLTTAGLALGLPVGCTAVSLDRDRLAAEPTTRPTVKLWPENLAYLIYTSGSTGQPKGTLISHHNVVRLLRATTPWYDFGPADVWTLFHSAAFDFSVWEMWGALAFGGRLVVVPYWVSRSPESFLELLATERVTVLNQTPSAFRQLIPLAAQQPTEVRALRAVIFGGEALQVAALADWFQTFGETRPRLINMYGITETTVHVTYCPLERSVTGQSWVSPIGIGIADLTLRVLGAQGELQPLGVVGELHVGGEGVCRGYLGRPALTASRLIPDRWGTTGGSRLYRTADLVRWLADGRLQYFGRLDFQVKIRGFRLELGEIEARLLQHPGVREAVVVVRADAAVLGGEPRLVAYWVGPAGAAEATGATGPSGLELRAFLARKLPEYMVPADYVALTALPLSPNGKVDRRALPVPASSGESLAAVVLPRNPPEELLAGIWSELLGREVIGIHDNFFELGGHSLLATQVIARVRVRFGVELLLADFFLQPTIAGLTAAVAAAQQTGAPPLVPQPREGDLPLSFAQERLWFLDQLLPQKEVYNLLWPLSFTGQLDPSALAWALGEIVRRHEALRTTFSSREGRPLQVVQAWPMTGWTAPFLPLVDLSALRLPEAEAQHLRQIEASWPFDLSCGPLLRTTLLRLGREVHHLLLSVHHIASDGWSMGVLVRELGVLYAAARSGQPSPLPALPLQYADYAQWQRQWLTGEVLARQIGYFRAQLGGAPARLELPTDRPRSALTRHLGGRVLRSLGADLRTGLRALCRESGSSLFMVLLAAFKTFLARHAGQFDVSVGSPIAGRRQVELEPLIGFFVNTLVLRSRLTLTASFRQFLEQLQPEVLAAFAHQDVPFERLVEELQPERSLSHQPLFQVVFILQNTPMGDALFPGLTVNPLPIPARTAKFDLTLSCAETGTGREGGLSCGLGFNREIFDPTTAERLLARFAVLLEQIVTDPDCPLGHLALLAAGERHQLSAEWNDTAIVVPAESVHGWFARVAREVPAAVALTEIPGMNASGSASVSYRELELRANALAHRLRALGAGPETLVGLGVERSLAAVVAILAILKTGAAYLPLDPEYPDARLAFMLADTRAPVVLVGPGARGLRAAGTTLELAVAGAGHAEQPPGGRTPADGLAYVMYTSGSTGRPKGVAVTHRNIVRLIWQADYAHFHAALTWLQLAPLSFDASTLELWGPLLHGGRLAIYPAGPVSLLELGQTLRAQRIHALWLTAGLFHQLVEDHLDDFRSVEQLLAGGDVLQPAAVRRVLTRTGITLINGYGPTETTTFACCHRLGSPAEVSASVPIGRPIRNARVWVLAPNLEPQPIGVIGELMIGGVGVSRGYWQHPAFTAERFLPALEGLAGARMYRTGDLVRFLPSGVLEFLGRSDFQVKLRGFRVEPGEIEAALAQHPGLSQVLVIVREDGGLPGDVLTDGMREGGATRGGRPSERRLVAYAVPAVGVAPSGHELREFLAQRLPAHLIPAAFVLLAAFPLGPTGKVDRRALPAPHDSEPLSEDTTPRTPSEELLAEIWRELLGVPQVGRHHNFFDLGGHSLLATQAISRIRTQFQVELPLRTLFEHPTLAELARAITEARRAAPPGPVPALTRRSDVGGLPLSFAQERLWFLAQLEPHSGSYNIPLAMRLRGPLQVAALAASLNAILRRHAVLRTRFEVVAGVPRQVVDRWQTRTLPLVDLSAISAAVQTEEIDRLGREAGRRAFDLAKDPMLRMFLLRLAPCHHVLALTLHHIAGDGWSWGVLQRELSLFYDACLRGEPAPLPPLPVSYADFAAWQREWLQGAVLTQELAYWRAQLSTTPRWLELPTDRPRKLIPSDRGEVVEWLLSSATATGLRRLARELGGTPFIVLLAVLQTLLGRLTGQREVAVGTPIAGRTRLELEGLIGLFLNNLVLVGDLSGRPSLRVMVERVRDQVLGAHAHQDLPFEKLVEELQPERALGHNPLYQVMLNLHNWMGLQGAALQLSALVVERVGFGERPAKLDLSVQVIERAGDDPGGLKILWQYRADLFDRTTLQRLAQQFELLLAASLLAPERSLAELGWLTPAQQQQVQIEWNDTAGEAICETLDQLVLQQAAAGAHRVALVCGTKALTYGELQRRANGLALALRRLGVGAETRVGISLSPSLGAPLALLAVLQTGGTYVPLDPKLPTLRREFMATDSEVQVVIQDLDPPALGGVPTLVLEADGWAIAPQNAPLASVTCPENLAYVVYTSGTTGQPKGVMGRHRGAVSFLRYLQAVCPLAPGDRVVQLAPLGFDASVREIFGPLSRGATVVLVASELRLDPAALHALLGAERIVGILAMVPSFLRTILTGASTVRGLSLQRLLLSGERLLPTDVAQVVAVWGPQVQVVNQYGPSECTMIKTYQVSEPQNAAAGFAADAAGQEAVLIGRPIVDARLQVRDRDLCLLPIGFAGELFIGSEDLARGYLHRPAVTAEKFIPDPAAASPGARAYATGDIVRWHANGSLEFIGRGDQQVKVLGNRVELGEIEAVLLLHPAVSGAAVVARESSPSQLRLVAYLEASSAFSQEKPPSSVLRSYLKEHLPEYMLPATWVWLERLPLTASGKVDRIALPTPTDVEPATNAINIHFVAPATDLEQLLATIWSEILGVARISRNDRFFDLGGHSLDAIRVVYRVEEFLGIDLEVRTLFEAQTLVELAWQVEAKLLQQVETLGEDDARAQLADLNPDGATGGLGTIDDVLAFLPSALAVRLSQLGTAQRGWRAERLRRALDHGLGERAIPRRADRRRAPLSFMQEAFWMIEQQEQAEVSVYRSNHRLQLCGPLDLRALAQSLSAMIARHEILRTRFGVDDQGQTYQEVVAEIAVLLPQVDLTGLLTMHREAEAQRILLQRSKLSFDLGQAPVWRLLLVREEPEVASLLLSMHHILNDHWSLAGIFFPELAACYQAFAARKTPQLPALSVQYGDYAQWERERLQDQVLARLLAYWGEKLQGGIPQLHLRTDRARPAVPRFRGAWLSFALSPALTSALEQCSRAADASLFMVSLAGYQLLLAQHSGQTDILVGSPAANRFRVQTEKLCGCFANMLLLRTSLAGDPTLEEFLARVRETVLGAFSHQELPFMLALANFPPADFAFDRSPFQAMFTFLNAPRQTLGNVEEGDRNLRFAGVQTIDRGATDQDLALWLTHGDSLKGTLIYDTDLFDRSTIEHMVADYQRWLELLSHHPAMRLSETL